MIQAHLIYLSAGGNRHPAASDWDESSGLFAYGADRNVGLWQPLHENHRGLQVLLTGHTDKVNAVKFFPQFSGQAPLILSGSVDRTVRVWRSISDPAPEYRSVAIAKGHESSINCIETVPRARIFITGSADATMRIWRLNSNANGDLDIVELQTIVIVPKLLPLALAAYMYLDTGVLILAMAGTRNFIQLYASEGESSRYEFHLKAALNGHEGWIRSLAFRCESDLAGADLLLASASQDKYIRLWRIHQGNEFSAFDADGQLMSTLIISLSNKTHRFEVANLQFSTTFEALLLGHEDWVYTVRWRPYSEQPQLLSSSADNSLAIWDSDAASGVWVCVTRLGEISAQKGSTTATGSTGGFWAGLWSPGGDAVVSLSRTGSWRLWRHDRDQDRWVQGLGICGHTKGVTSIAWSKNGSYLLSTASDQTTRLHAEWKDGAKRSWHEFARPQIHGYDLNCLDTIGESQFVSGADEKLLRVFDEPKAVAEILEQSCYIPKPLATKLYDAANMPVLGLSNKAVQALDDSESPSDNAFDEINLANLLCDSSNNIPRPLFENYLARHTLWPEKEKLYGHGYEISAVAASKDGTLVATACRASSVDHAVIRLYETVKWRMIMPPLKSHSLTVTGLRFSDDDQYLLSVGRDRQWTVFERKGSQPELYELRASNSKGHARMILDASWAPSKSGRCFATASRDKMVKVWHAAAESFTCQAIIDVTASVTAIDFLPLLVKETLVLAVGIESGKIDIYLLGAATSELVLSFAVDTRLCPSKSIAKLSWRPDTESNVVIKEERPRENRFDNQVLYLAIASEDGSLRICSISINDQS